MISDGTGWTLDEASLPRPGGRGLALALGLSAASAQAGAVGRTLGGGEDMRADRTIGISDGSCCLAQAKATCDGVRPSWPATMRRAPPCRRRWTASATTVAPVWA